MIQSYQSNVHLWSHVYLVLKVKWRLGLFTWRQLHLISGVQLCYLPVLCRGYKGPGLCCSPPQTAEQKHDVLYIILHAADLWACLVSLILSPQSLLLAWTIVVDVVHFIYIHLYTTVIQLLLMLCEPCTTFFFSVTEVNLMVNGSFCSRRRFVMSQKWVTEALRIIALILIIFFKPRSTHHLLQKRKLSALQFHKCHLSWEPSGALLLFNVVKWIKKTELSDLNTVFLAVGLLFTGMCNGRCWGYCFLSVENVIIRGTFPQWLISCWHHLEPRWHWLETCGAGGSEQEQPMGPICNTSMSNSSWKITERWRNNKTVTALLLRDSIFTPLFSAQTKSNVGISQLIHAVDGKMSEQEREACSPALFHPPLSPMRHMTRVRWMSAEVYLSCKGPPVGSGHQAFTALDLILQTHPLSCRLITLIA